MSLNHWVGSPSDHIRISEGTTSLRMHYRFGRAKALGPGARHVVSDIAPFEVISNPVTFRVLHEDELLRGAHGKTTIEALPEAQDEGSPKTSCRRRR